MNAEFQFKHEIPVQIRFSDVDQYGHMNNSFTFPYTIWLKHPISVMYLELKNAINSVW